MYRERQNGQEQLLQGTLTVVEERRVQRETRSEGSCEARMEARSYGQLGDESIDPLASGFEEGKIGMC